MNREILYRGKRVDNGEWVEGYLVEKTDFDAGGVVCQSYIVEKVNFGRNADDDTRFCDIDEIEVIPETVGQFTGLTDKNGNKIFESDIIKGDKKQNSCGYVACPVLISYYDGAFCGVDSEKIYYPICDSEHFFDLEMYEVVGNVYDNPELLADET